MFTMLACARKPLDFQKEAAEQISKEVAHGAVVNYVKDDAVLNLTTFTARKKTEEDVCIAELIVFCSQRRPAVVVASLRA